MTLFDGNPRRYLHDIEAEAAVFDKTLQATDPRLQGYVYVQLDDGSTFVFDSAFAVTVDDGEWLAVFTEHHRFHVYCMSDVVWYRWFPQHHFPAPVADWQKSTRDTSRDP